MGSAFCRVSVMAPHRRLDLALPADVAVAELTPMLLEVLGTELPRGRAPLPWRLGTVTGEPFPPSASLAELRIRDGDLLRLAPDEPAPAPPVVDDVPGALAEAVARHPRRPDDGVLPLAGLAAVVLTAALLMAVRPGPGAPAGGAVLPGVSSAVSSTVVAVGGALVAAAAAVVAIMLAGRRAARRLAESGEDRVPEVCSALAGVALAAAAGWLAYPGGARSAAALLAGVAAALATMAGQAVLRIVAPVLLAVLPAAVATALGGGAALALDASAPAVAAVVGTVALLLGPLLPGLALRLAGVSANDGAAGIALARGHYAGLVLGSAGTAAVAAVLAATGSGWPGPVLAATISVVLLLRSRGVAEPFPARSLQVSGLLALVAGLLCTDLPALRVTLAAGVLAALLIRVFGEPAQQQAPSPPARRLVDIAELVLTAAAVPLAFAAIDLFALVRGW